MKRLHFNQGDEDEPKKVGWLTTFNDLVTLLMVFFVLMFTMSTIDTKKMGSFQYALQSGLGILKLGNKSPVSVKKSQPIDDMSHVMTQAEGERIMEKGIADRKLAKAVRTLSEDEFGIQVIHSDDETRLVFEDQILFDFGKDAINPEGFPLLNKIAQALIDVPYRLRVEGHTDNVPIRTKRFPSNWELSAARAVNVVKYFIRVSKLDPQRLSAVGYGDSRPVVPNDTPFNRAKNRRVEILLLTEGIEENVK
ncbi:MAG: flagellar motor protein MotB [Desulfobacterales bacterium]